MGLSQQQREDIAHEARRINYLEQLDDWTEIDRERRRARRVEVLILVCAALALAMLAVTFAIRSAKAEPNTNRQPQAAIAPAVPNGLLMMGGGRPQNCPTRAWCGCWLGFQFGMTDKALWNARRWSKVGRPAPAGCVGCVAVLSRGRGGHVGIVQGYQGRNPIVLSGNHNNAVGVGVYPARRVIAYRDL